MKMKRELMSVIRVKMRMSMTSRASQQELETFSGQASFSSIWMLTSALSNPSLSWCLHPPQSNMEKSLMKLSIQIIFLAKRGQLKI